MQWSEQICSCRVFPAFRWVGKEILQLPSDHPKILYLPTEDKYLYKTMFGSRSFVFKSSLYLKGVSIKRPQARSLNRFYQPYQLTPSKHSRLGLHIVAFRGSSDEAVIVPLDAFHILQVNRAASKDTCLKAYDKLVNTIPDAGFSEVRLFRFLSTLS